MTGWRLVRLGLLGFGSVGRAFARLVFDEAERLDRDHGVRLEVTGICTGRSGSRYAEAGLDVAELLRAAAAGDVHGPSVAAAEFAGRCPADVIVETMPLEPWTGATAIEATRAALRSGRSVVSANKGPVAHGLRELETMAAEHGVSYRFESAVADGLPVFNLLRWCLPAADVTAFSGVLNSTSQMVLQSLARGGAVAEAVLDAQQSGIAEVDPSYDLEGWDAAVKLAALSAAVWDRPMALDLVDRQPVDERAAAWAVDAAARGRRLVSLAEAARSSGSGDPVATVRLTEIGPDHVLYAVSGASLGLTITSRLLCPITVSSLEPAPRDTAYGLLSDLLAIAGA